MNQGKLEVVKQEMARVNIDILGISKMARVNINILGISKLKWTGMGEFNSDNITSTIVGKNPVEEMV